MQKEKKTSQELAGMIQTEINVAAATWSAADEIGLVSAYWQFPSNGARNDLACSRD